MDTQDQETLNTPPQLEGGGGERVWKFDRTRVQTYQECPRKRLLEFEIEHPSQPSGGVKGVVPQRKSQDLLIGIGVHEGLSTLLSTKDIEKAVEVGTASFLDSYGEGMVVDSWNPAATIPNDEFHRLQAVSLVEGLIRGFFLSLYPQVMERFEVLEVEEEREVEWPNPLPLLEAPLLILMSREDGLLRDRESGEIYVLSWKTATSWGVQDELRWRCSLQNAMHHIAYNTLLNSWEDNGPEWFNRYEPKQVDGTMMGVLLKGTKRQNPEGSGRYVRYSPLLGGWKQETEWQTSYSATWEVEKTNPKTGEVYKGVLGNQWKRFFCWEEPMGIKGWVEWLQENAPLVLENQFVFGSPWQITPSWITEVEVMVRDQEEAIAQGLNPFPRHPHSCVSFQQKCPFYSICWEGNAGMDGYVPRTPHHLGEDTSE